jgi:hypothetical protein
MVPPLWLAGKENIFEKPVAGHLFYLRMMRKYPLSLEVVL